MGVLKIAQRSFVWKYVLSHTCIHVTCLLITVVHFKTNQQHFFNERSTNSTSDPAWGCTCYVLEFTYGPLKGLWMKMTIWSYSTSGGTALHSGDGWWDPSSGLSDEEWRGEFFFCLYASCLFAGCRMKGGRELSFVSQLAGVLEDQVLLLIFLSLASL